MSKVLKEMTNQEIDKYLLSTRRDIMNLRFNFAVSRSLPNPSKIGLLKKNVARALTIKNERKGLEPNKDKVLAKTNAKRKMI